MEPTQWLLRWCFEYSDHKPTKYGMFSTPGTFDSEKASKQSKENLLFAKIEGKNVLTREIVPLAVVDGHEFVNFQWVSSSSVGGFRLKGSVTLAQKIIGMTLVTREKNITIYTNGQAKIEDHNIDYSKVHLSGFGR